MMLLNTTYEQFVLETGHNASCKKYFLAYEKHNWSKLHAEYLQHL